MMFNMLILNHSRASYWMHILYVIWFLMAVQTMVISMPMCVASVLSNLHDTLQRHTNKYLIGEHHSSRCLCTSIYGSPGSGVWTFICAGYVPVHVYVWAYARSCQLSCKCIHILPAMHCSWLGKAWNNSVRHTFSIILFMKKQIDEWIRHASIKHIFE